MEHKRKWMLLALAALMIVAVAVPATAAITQFTDVPDANIFANDIQWMADNDVTRGCNSDGTLFCPQDNVTREQMSAFMRRLATGGAVDAGTLDGLNSTAFLRKNATAADSDLLDGLNSTAFLRKTAQAADSALLDGRTATDFDNARTLDGLDSTDFLGVGDITIGYHPSDWVDNGNTTNPIDYYTDSARLHEAAQLAINGPGIIDGVMYGPKSAEICYRAVGTAYITSTWFQTTVDGVWDAGTPIATDRTSTTSTCYTEPITPAYADTWDVYLSISGGSASDYVRLHGVNVIWTPTTNLASASVAGETPADAGN